MGGGGFGFPTLRRWQKCSPLCEVQQPLAVLLDRLTAMGGPCMSRAEGLARWEKLRSRRTHLGEIRPLAESRAMQAT
jgi:hypothetical protein